MRRNTLGRSRGGDAARERGRAPTSSSVLEENHTKSASSFGPVGHKPGLLSDFGGVGGWCAAMRTKEMADAACSACWGAHFSSGACPPHFIPGRLHFKNKFCASCRACLPVPLTHVLALSREQAIRFVNKRTEGFWNIAPASMGGGAYRVVNNTAGCVGPLLVLFREAAPPNIQASMIPEQWANDEGYLCLSVAKGTLVPAQLLRCGQPHASAKRRKVAALPLLPAQLAAMLADSDADTGQAEDLIEAFAAGAPEIGAFAAGAPEVLSPIEAHHVARASGSVVAAVRAYPAQQAADARAVGVQSSLRGASQGLQDGLEGELHDLLQDVPVQMLHGKEMEELQAGTLDASYGDDEAAASWNEAGDDAGREEAIGEAASYELLRMHDLGSCTNNTIAHSDGVPPTDGVFEVLKSAYHHVNSALHTVLGDERVSGIPTLASSVTLPNHDSHLRGTCTEVERDRPGG